MKIAPCVETSKNHFESKTRVENAAHSFRAEKLEINRIALNLNLGNKTDPTGP